jgi:hypothetical protein
MPLATRFKRLITFDAAGREWRIVLHADQIRNLSDGNFLPFEKAISRNETTPFPECLPV